MTTLRDAPTHARKLVKSLTFRKRSIQHASRSEERQVAGAKAEREDLTVQLHRDIARVESAIAHTSAAADDFDRAAMAAKAGTPLAPQGPISALVNIALQIGADPRATLLQDVAERCQSAVTKAQERMDQGQAELEAVKALCHLTAVLPTCGFDPKHKRAEVARRAYLTATQTAADQRNKQ